MIASLTAFAEDLMSLNGSYWVIASVAEAVVATVAFWIWKSRFVKPINNHK